MQVIVNEPTQIKQYQRKRVAAYARVSRETAAKLHSFNAQVEYYRKALDMNPGYDLVDVYADLGISGTLRERPEFQRLLADCRAGLIDVVITKSITRFARNLEVCLESIRQLTALGIDVYFEKEGIHTSDCIELELIFQAQMAEETARIASENQKWRVHDLFKQGKANTGRMIGYTLVDNQLVQIPNEVEIVKFIFQTYLDGAGTTKIARMLNDHGIPTIKGNHWAPNTIWGILRNEKYMGDMVLQKSYTVDFRSKKKRKNRGERDQYEVKDSHEGIISKETFEAVQQEIVRRREKYAHKIAVCDQEEAARIKQEAASVSESIPDSSPWQEPNSEDPPAQLFKSLIVCGNCGRHYGFRANRRQKPHPRPIWICSKSSNLGQTACNSKAVPHPVMVAKTKEVLADIAKDEHFAIKRLSNMAIRQHINYITIANSNQIIFHTKNHGDIIREWSYASRRESWTEEMKAQARIKTQQRIIKEKENQ